MFETLEKKNGTRTAENKFDKNFDGFPASVRDRKKNNNNNHISVSIEEKAWRLSGINPLSQYTLTTTKCL